MSVPDPKTGDNLVASDSSLEILADAAARARRYLQTIRDRHVGVPQAALDNLAALGGALPVLGQNPRSVLEILDEKGSPATIASPGGRFFGGVIGGALPVTVAAHWLADAWDQNACRFLPGVGIPGNRGARLAPGALRPSIERGRSFCYWYADG